MAANPHQLLQVEGQWEELVRNSQEFAGRRVRVTVLADDPDGNSGFAAERRRWLVEGNAMEMSPPAANQSSPFGDALIEKFRRQGLEL
jgi:hypothetical protein